VNRGRGDRLMLPYTAVIKKIKQVISVIKKIKQVIPVIMKI